MTAQGSGSIINVVHHGQPRGGWCIDVLFLASAHAGFVTGEIVHVNGGKTVTALRAGGYDCE